MTGALDLRPGSLARPAEGPPRSARAVPIADKADLGIRPPLTSRRTKRISDLNVGEASGAGRKAFGFSHELLDESGKTYYEGEFKCFLRHGQGTLCTQGSKYTGQFQADRCHGRGEREFVDGCSYKGEWKNGRKHGNGEFVDEHGQKYVGQWENGCRHGSGTQEYVNGDKYIGGWYNGLCAGVGTYFFADGSRYEGAWTVGRYEGVGVLYGADGTRERRVYAQGVMQCREILEDGQPPPLSQKRRDFTTRRVLMTELRDDMIRPTILGMPKRSPHAVKKESDGWDLSAPPLRSRLLTTNGLGSGLGPPLPAIAGAGPACAAGLAATAPMPLSWAGIRA